MPARRTLPLRPPSLYTGGCMGDQRRRIFSTLFNVYTIFVWGWVVIEFLSRGATETPSALVNVYLIVLAYYVGDKEIARWHHRHQRVRRRGELFVLGWAATAVLTLLIEILGGEEHGYQVPRQLPLIAGSVVTIYVITEYLKAEYRRRAR